MTLPEQLDLIQEQIEWLALQSRLAATDAERSEILGRVRQLGRELERLVPELKDAP